MAPNDQLLEIERAGWRALSGGDPVAHYEDVLAGEVLMLLPGGMVIDDRDAVVESMQGAAWDSHDLSDERVLSLNDDTAVVAYRATARRDGTDYTALFNSTYVREGDQWKLAVHQQTPV
jgi:hypothetical protein